MPMFEVRIKANMKVRDEIITARDIEDAQKQILAKFPAAEIASIRQRVAGSNAETRGISAPTRKKSPIAKLVVVVIVLAAIVIAAWKMGLLKKIGL